MDAFLKTSNEVNAEASASNADFKKMYDHLVAFKNGEYLWWQVAEYSYDGFMIRSRGRGSDLRRPGAVVYRRRGSRPELTSQRGTNTFG
jgi:hypothetical protein